MTTTDSATSVSLHCASLNSLPVADLDTVANGTAAAASGDMILEREIDEDAILADYDETFSEPPDDSLLPGEGSPAEDLLLSEPSTVPANIDDDESSSKPDDSLLHNEDLLLSEPSLVAPKMAMEVDAVDNGTAAASCVQVLGIQIEEDLASLDQIKYAKLIEVVKGSLFSGKQSHLDASTKDTATIAATLSQASAPEATGAMTAPKQAPIKLNRSKRFHVSLPSAIPGESEKMKQRASRFGEVVSVKGKSLDEKYRAEKRKERFGLMEVNTAKRAKVVGDVDPIQKRQDRFDYVGQEADKDELPKGFNFKPRRYRPRGPRSNGGHGARRRPPPAVRRRLARALK